VQTDFQPMMVQQLREQQVLTKAVTIPLQHTTMLPQTTTTRLSESHDEH
jgi:hypothetical protein